MKRLFTYIIFHFCVICSYGQLPGYYVVVDKDGYANVRDESKKIVDKIASGELVWRFEGSSEWVEIDYYGDNEAKFGSGLIHKSRIKFLADFTKIPKVKSTKSEVIFKKDLIEVKISKKRFAWGSRKKTYDKEGSYIRKINGKSFWGSDGTFQQYEYDSIKIAIDGKQIDFPVSEYENLFEPWINNAIATYDLENDILYIECGGSDASEGYHVAWVFEKKKYKKRYIYHGF